MVDTGGRAIRILGDTLRAHQAIPLINSRAIDLPLARGERMTAVLGRGDACPYKRSAPRFASVLLGRGDSFCFEILLEALQAVLPPDPRLLVAAEGTVGAVRHCAIDHE